MRDTELISSSQASKILGLVPDYVRKLARTGHLPIALIVGNGQRLYERRAVERFAAERARRRKAPR
jgi:hypothetical protein